MTYGFKRMKQIGHLEPILKKKVSWVKDGIREGEESKLEEIDYSFRTSNLSYIDYDELEDSMKKGKNKEPGGQSYLEIRRNSIGLDLVKRQSFLTQLEDIQPILK